jgi:exodeoxyribonuclease VII large subunit
VPSARHPDEDLVAVGDRPALSITELYGRVDRALQDALPGEVWVSGEVRSFNVSSRGHCYLDLVDPKNAQDTGSPVLKVVCWSGRWSRVRSSLDQLGITLDAGLVVRVRGEVQLYKPRGDISFILSELDTDALLGKVAAERARLVKALLDEGLFDRNRRIPVSPVPLRIGLVASPGTEGFRDFLGRLEASGMAFDVTVTPTQVQGREAPASVAAAIGSLQTAGCDVIVVVRGGGSKSDLATFDTEVVARAIASSEVAVWTGIGHTGDQSVADEIANRAFITPTECGQELARRVTERWTATIAAGADIARRAGVVEERAVLHLGQSRSHLASGARMQLGRHGDGLVHSRRNLRAAAHHQLGSHTGLLASQGEDLASGARRRLDDADRLHVRRSTLLATLPQRRIELDERQVSQWRRLLGAYDYQRQLERGYSVTRGPDGSVLRSSAGVAPGDALVTLLADGALHSVVGDPPAADGSAEAQPRDGRIDAQPDDRHRREAQ